MRRTISHLSLWELVFATFRWRRKSWQMRAGTRAVALPPNPVVVLLEEG